MQQGAVVTRLVPPVVGVEVVVELLDQALARHDDEDLLVFLLHQVAGDDHHRHRLPGGGTREQEPAAPVERNLDQPVLVLERDQRLAGFPVVDIECLGELLDLLPGDLPERRGEHVADFLRDRDGNPVAILHLQVVTRPRDHARRDPPLGLVVKILVAVEPADVVLRFPGILLRLVVVGKGGLHEQVDVPLRVEVRVYRIRADGGVRRIAHRELDDKFIFSLGFSHRIYLVPMPLRFFDRISFAGASFAHAQNVTNSATGVKPYPDFRVPES